jgi:hypothetical protein
MEIDMRTAIAVCFALLTIVPAHARDRQTTITFSRVINEAPSARIIHVPEGDPVRAEAWEAFCKPAPRTDALGVTRYSYAHAGCEFGRIE